MAVYERATRAVEPAQQYDMFNIYIKRAAEIYGVTHTRGIYQKAIEVPTAGGADGVLQAELSVPAPGGCQHAFWTLKEQPGLWGTPEVALLSPHALSAMTPSSPRCCLTSTPERCACGLRTWSASSGR